MLTLFHDYINIAQSLSPDLSALLTKRCATIILVSFVSLCIRVFVSSARPFCSFSPLCSFTNAGFLLAFFLLSFRFEGVSLHRSLRLLFFVVIQRDSFGSEKSDTLIVKDRTLFLCHTPFDACCFVILNPC